MSYHSKSTCTAMQEMRLNVFYTTLDPEENSFKRSLYLKNKSPRQIYLVFGLVWVTMFWADTGDRSLLSVAKHDFLNLFKLNK